MRLLDEGGMGEVYLICGTDLGRNAAVKIISAERIIRDSNLERLVREAQTASALNHPNICTIYELDQKHDPPFIAVEYMECETLADLIQSGKLPVEFGFCGETYREKCLIEFW